MNACDKLEGMIYPLTVKEVIMNHELFAVYADNAVKSFPLLLPIYKNVKGVLRGRFEEWGFDWLDEYDEVFFK